MAVVTRPSSGSLTSKVLPLSDFDESRVFDHSSFLRRNGVLLQALLGTAYERRRVSLPFHQRLLVFVATERPAELLDGRVLRGLKRAFASRNLSRGDVAFWRRRLSSSLGPQASQRVARLVEVLKGRADFPGLSSMVKWGLPRWEDLFSRLGIDGREARTFVSLVLGREEYLPAGSRYEHVYRRLGVRLDQHGLPRRDSFAPGVTLDLGWKLAALADDRCTIDLDLGGPACRTCPVLRFCQKGRYKTFETREGPEFIDVFAGGGGMSLGFSQAGFKEKVAVELDTHAADTLYFNHPEVGQKGILCCGVEELHSDHRFIEENKGVPVLIGGPPCQPFSIVRRHKHPDERDERRFLFRPFLQIACALQVRFVIMENVPGIKTAANGDALSNIAKEFNQAGFEVDHRVLDAADYGVPQRRRRVFFVGVNRVLHQDAKKIIGRFWSALDAERVGSPVTVAEALSGIPRIEPGQGGDAVRKRPGKRTVMGRAMANGTPYAFNHEARPHNERDIRIFKLLKRGEPAWKLEARLPGTIPYQTDTFRDKFRKLRLCEPSPTIPAHLSRDANSFVHPHVPRGITCREAARLQSFPDDYVFLGGLGPSFIQAGNAVPPLLARAVARATMAALPSPKSS